MKKYFTYDNEYISGGQFFLRNMLFFILSLLLVGIYLSSVNAYKRSKSLGHDDNTATIWGIWGFLMIPLAFTPIALITNTIPYWYLWWSDGNPTENNEKTSTQELKEETRKKTNFSKVKSKLKSENLIPQAMLLDDAKSAGYPPFQKGQRDIEIKMLVGQKVNIMAADSSLVRFKKTRDICLENDMIDAGNFFQEYVNLYDYYIKNYDKVGGPKS